MTGLLSRMLDEVDRDFNDSSDAGIVGIVQGGFDTEVASHFVVGIGADWTFGDVLGDLDRNNTTRSLVLIIISIMMASTMVDVYWPRRFRSDCPIS